MSIPGPTGAVNRGGSAALPCSLLACCLTSTHHAHIRLNDLAKQSFASIQNGLRTAPGGVTSTWKKQGGDKYVQELPRRQRSLPPSWMSHALQAGPTVLCPSSLHILFCEWSAYHRRIKVTIVKIFIMYDLNYSDENLTRIDRDRPQIGPSTQALNAWWRDQLAAVSPVGI